MLTRKLLNKRIIKQFFFIVDMFNKVYLLGLLLLFFFCIFCKFLLPWAVLLNFSTFVRLYILYCLLYYNKNLINWYDSHNLSILLLAHVSYCVGLYFPFSFFAKKIFKKCSIHMTGFGYSDANIIYNSIVTKANLCIVKITYIYFHIFIFALSV